MHCFKFDISVIMHNLLYFMKLRIVSDTPYFNYSLLCMLVLDVFCSTRWNLIEYKLLFSVVIFCYILIIYYYVNYGLPEVLLIKLSVIEYNYVKRISDSIMYRLVYNIFYDIYLLNWECCWVLAVLYCNG